MKTLLLYSIVYLARFLSIIASDAYLPLDRSGDWVYRCTEGAGVITMGLLLLCARRFRHTYYSHIVALPFPCHLGFVWLLLSLPPPPLPLRGSECLRSCQLKLVHPGRSTTWWMCCGRSATTWKPWQSIRNSFCSASRE